MQFFNRIFKKLSYDKTNKKPIKSYHYINVKKANKLVSIRGKSILVVGCSTGIDCSLFVNFGAREVHGVDVDDKIGNDFQHKKVTYYKNSAAEMSDIKNDKYDLVYCLATLEHVDDLNNALKEMVRVTKPGGHIYAYSAPLWNSSQGHHKANFFKNYPWIHLRHTQEEIMRLCEEMNLIDDGDGITVREHVEYMLNPVYFNMEESTKYVVICSKLKTIKIIRNQLVYEDDALLTEKLFNELKPKGYTREELLASGHLFIAQRTNE